MSHYPKVGTAPPMPPVKPFKQSSVCGYDQLAEQYKDVSFSAIRCPSCGAKMGSHAEDHLCRMHRGADGRCNVCSVIVVPSAMGKTDDFARFTRKCLLNTYRNAFGFRRFFLIDYWKIKLKK